MPAAVGCRRTRPWLAVGTEDARTNVWELKAQQGPDCTRSQRRSLLPRECCRKWDPDRLVRQCCRSGLDQAHDSVNKRRRHWHVSARLPLCPNIAPTPYSCMLYAGGIAIPPGCMSTSPEPATSPSRPPHWGHTQLALHHQFTFWMMISRHLLRCNRAGSAPPHRQRPGRRWRTPAKLAHRLTAASAGQQRHARYFGKFFWCCGMLQHLLLEVCTAQHRPGK